MDVYILRRVPHEFMDPTCKQRTDQSVGAFLMVQDVCSWLDMTCDSYINILSNQLHLFLSIVHSHEF